MYSKQEKQALIADFWTAFAQAYPHKWLLYNTKIKDLQLKFDVQSEGVRVLMQISIKQAEMRIKYFEQLLAMKSLLADYFEELVFDRDVKLVNGKIVSEVAIAPILLNFHNRTNWPNIFTYMAENMLKLETFFLEYQDIINQAADH